MDLEKANQAKAQDLYSLEPEQTGSVPQQLKQRLIEQANLFHQHQQQFQKFDFFHFDYYYIVSKKWFQRWKVYSSYDTISNNQPPHKLLGVGQMPILNEDIVSKQTTFSIFFPQQYQQYNVALNRGIQEQKDYIFMSQNMWNVFSHYQRIPVKRYVINSPTGKIVEMHFQKITTLTIFNQFLRTVQHNQNAKCYEAVFQVSPYMTIKDMGQLIKNHLRSAINTSKYPSKIFDSQLPIRFWLLSHDIEKNHFMNSLRLGCKANPSFSYKMYIQAELMNDQQQIKQYDILQNTYIVAQLKQAKQNWNFFNHKHQLEGSCNQCRLTKALKFLCSCKYAAYCSKQCKYKDKTSHAYRCPNQAESEEEEFQLMKTSDSRMGIVGLRNLGNTCFMNSGLQCLSHVFQLTQYFLTGKYQSQINKENPLGTKGQLSVCYAKLIKTLWYGKDPSFAPTQLKRAISKFQPMFSGYNQHDSGQLVTYLLDGLHEDLNRVKVKPYVQTKDYDGRPDYQIAKQSWEQFLMRNKSEIVDLMYGQFRSVIDCPNCSTHSIVFNPFLMCQLPIISVNKKKFELIFIRDHVYQQKMTIMYQKSWNWKMSDIFAEVKKNLGLKDDSKLIAYSMSFSYCYTIDQNSNANQTRKEFEHRKIYVRQLLHGENPSTDIKVYLGNTKCYSNYSDQTFRKNISPYRLYFLSRDLNCQQVHHRLYAYYKKAYPLTSYAQQVINVQKKDQPLRILLNPASKYYACDYCGEKGCQGCPLPYSAQKKFGQIIPQKDDKVEMQLYWRKNIEEVEKFFDEKDEQSEKIQKSGGNQTSLVDCFKLFEAPETLTQENQWYCPKCKDFVCAKIQMQIYKAPKILIILLKRFKRKEWFSEKYQILVDFPVNGLDLTEYVINKDLPNDYFKQKMEMEDEQHNKLIYDLFAITNHFGGTGGGHYTAYCKNNNQWYDFDDSYVNPVKQTDVVSESAYVLFYHRRQ